MGVEAKALLTHTHMLAASRHFQAQKQLLPSSTPCANGSLFFHMPNQVLSLTALCTLKVLSPFCYPHALK